MAGGGTSPDPMDVLRATLRRRSLKLSEVSDRLKVPYKTLHNYFSKTSDMPLSVYVRICRLAGIPLDYPLNGGRSKLATHSLQQALIDVLGAALPTIQKDDAMTLSAPSTVTRVDADLRRDAQIIAVMVEGRYDLSIERQLGEPIDAAD